MKSIIYTVILSFFLVLSGMSQNMLLSLTGQVYDTLTGNPVSNQIVTAEIMSGGMVSAYDMITNQWGQYGDSLFVFEEGDFVVSTIDCEGNLHSYSNSFGPNNYFFNYDFYICSDSITMECAASFAHSLPPMGGTTVFFSNYSTGNPDSWSWSFGDGSTSTEWEPVHQYNATGIYTVCLSIWSDDSTCYDNYCEDIIVGDTIGDCQNFFWYESWNMVDFVFMGESLPTEADYYFWDFGDGTTGDGQTVSHTYSADSNMFVIVSLTSYVYNPASGDTCVAESYQDVWIGGTGMECSNWFWYDTFDAYTFNFNGEGLPPAVDYFWDFGDGNTGNGQNVQHTYGPGSAGEMAVTLTTIHFNAGAADTCVAYSDQVIIVGDSIVDCENFFWYLPTGNNSYLFTGQALPEADYYSWDFGDGQTALGQEVEHTFDPNQGDAFLVTLTTVGLTPAGDTCLASSVQEVWINNGGWDCENWFWYETWDITTFNFFGEAFPFPADEFYWDLGDGTVANGPELTHTYEASTGDVFLVTLISMGFDPVTGDTCVAESVQEIIIGGSTGDCENFFWYESGNDFTFDFFGESLPNPADYYYWDFGDGTTSNGQFVSHTFDPSMGDMFVVCLTTYSMDPVGDSCVAESCQEILLGGQSGVEIFGTIFSESEPVDAALVGLFGADPDSFYYEFTLTQPGTGSYFFENVPVGEYYIFTSLTPQSEDFYDYFPTYYGDAIFWFEAELIDASTPENPYDIHMAPITSNAAGPGKINGTVTMEDGKNGPGENITVVLMNEDHNALDFIQTSETGEFNFEDLAFGTYTLKVEIPGVNSEIALVVLNEEHMITELNFYVKDNSAYLGVEDKLTAVSTIGDVFPNPVSNLARIDLAVLDPTEILIQVIDPKGRILSSGTQSFNQGSQLLEVKTAGLAPGLYYLHLIDKDGNSISRKFIK